MAVWPSKVKQKRGSASARSSTPSTRSTRRSRNRWKGSYHSRSQWVWGTRCSILGDPCPWSNRTSSQAASTAVPMTLRPSAAGGGQPTRRPGLALRGAVLQERGHAGQVGGDGRVVLVGQAAALGAGVQLGHPLGPGQVGPGRPGGVEGQAEVVVHQGQPEPRVAVVAALQL